MIENKQCSVSGFIFISLQDTTGFNTPLLRPRVIGEWMGREENDADPLAAEMLQPPIPRNKNEQWDSEDSSSPGGRWDFRSAWKFYNL